MNYCTPWKQTKFLEIHNFLTRYRSSLFTQSKQLHAAKVQNDYFEFKYENKPLQELEKNLLRQSSLEKII